MVSLSGRAPAPPPSPLARDGLVRRSVVVTLDDETGARGVLWQADESGLVLAPAAGESVLVWSPASNEWEPMDGQLFVPAARIKFVQIPEGMQ